MMKGFVVSVVLLLLNMAIVTQAIRCANPTRFKGRWVIGVDRKECVALVKEKCQGLRRYTTHRWRRGIRVRGNCRKVPRWSAIATFLDGNRYRGHAAIFESCAKDGIWVYDQWNTAPVMRRKIRYGYRMPNYNGNNFYMIKL
ncbi:domesticated amidase effector 2-like [Rhipicephalus microplus]|uniref:domesticated amidase effector 2-like n=1 Tax=Rhipicephalus microplus TaxID=6941 RepID=UPI003F6C1C4E